MIRSNMNSSIRKAGPEDIDAIVQITKENNHFWTPAVDGVQGLSRLMERDSNILLVAEDPEGDILGFIIGAWDGARAMLTKLSVRPGIQKQGIGTMLVNGAVEELKGMGAPTVGVLAADGTRPDEEENDSTGFWSKVGFEYIPARLMIKFDIQEEKA